MKTDRYILVSNSKCIELTLYFRQQYRCDEEVRQHLARGHGSF